MGKGVPPKGDALLIPSRLTDEPLTGQPPQPLPASLSKAVQKYGYSPNQQKQNNYQKETITTNKKDLSINDKVLYIFNISEKRKMAAKNGKIRNCKAKIDTKKPASGTPAGNNKNYSES